MWDLPGPGLEPRSPALAGGFLTTAPPGKPLSNFMVRNMLYDHNFNKIKILLVILLVMN